MNPSRFSEVKRAAAGRWEHLLAELAPDLGTALERKGRHVACPVHGGIDGFRLFRDVAESGGGVCNTCGSFHDGFALLAWVNGWTLAETLEAVAERLGIARNITGKVATKVAGCNQKKSTDDGREVSEKVSIGNPKKERPESPPAAKAARIAAWWKEASENAPLLRAYLEHRGLTLAPPPTLRLHPGLGYWHVDRQGEEPVKLATAPAMLALVEGPNGAVVGLHRTYLQPDGRGKLDIAHQGEALSPKKLYSTAPRSTNGGAIRLYPPTGTLAIAEGIETALAVRQATGLPVWACMTAGGMERVELPETVREVILMADRDFNGTGERAARALAKRLVREGRKVKVVLPPAVGIDWLDVVNGEVGHG